MPRSPSRDLADRYLGNRTYFRRMNRLEKWKWGLSFLALLVAGLYVAAGYVRKTNDYRLTHGPLTNVHATWDNECVVCHLPASEVKDAGFLRADKRWAALTCDKCHAGPQHFKGQTDDDGLKDCAACHHDHQGRDNSLVRIADSHCTRCHADGAGGKHPDLKKIPNLAEHPTMKVFAKEGTKDEHKRGLRFSHALHLSPGLAYPWDKGPSTLRKADDYAKLDGSGRYKKYDKGGVLQLDCDACHQTDSGLMGKDITRPELSSDPNAKDALEQLLKTLPRYAVRPPRGNGDIFLPVSYDLHCKTCHPNTGAEKSIAGKLLDDFPNFHRLQPKELLQTLERQYIGNAYATTLNNTKNADPADTAKRAAELKTEQEKIKQEKKPRTLDDLLPLPGASSRPPANVDPPPPPKTPGVAPRLDMDLARQARTVAEQWVDLALTQRSSADGPAAASYCAKCHAITGDPAGKVADRRIAQTNSPSVWYANAKFNHAAHRGTTCDSCHGGVRLASGESYKKIGDQFSADPMAGKKAFAATENPKPSAHLPGFDECRKCHGPATVTNGDATGGIRYGCTECHRYHNGEHPLQGRGAGSRNPTMPYETFTEFLSGRKAKPTVTTPPTGTTP